MNWKSMLLTASITLALSALTVQAAAKTEGPFKSEKEMKAAWKKYCGTCHGKDGKGKTKMGRKSGVKDYTDPAVVAKFKKPEEQFKMVKEGYKEDGKTKMKPFKDKLSDEQIKQLNKMCSSFVPKK